MVDQCLEEKSLILSENTQYHQLSIDLVKSIVSLPEEFWSDYVSDSQATTKMFPFIHINSKNFG
jgi:hypothetical protein